MKPHKEAESEKTLGDKRRIKICRNGPYLVSGRIPLAKQIMIYDAEGLPYEWHEGRRYPSDENYTLCRCGRSRNKPFCDGTHTKIGFEGTETASREPYLKQSKKIYGPSLKLTDVQELCVHARFCDRAGGTWDLTKQSDDPNARRIAIEEAGNCPSGRLVVWDKETKKPFEPDFEKSIGLVEDIQEAAGGPIWVRGGIPIESADGTTYEIRNRVTLCHCGKSSNKPFCDGSHTHTT